MLEDIRIRKAGYSIRIDFEPFSKRYQPIVKAFSKTNPANIKEATQTTLQVLSKKIPKFKDSWQIGFTKAFLKEEARTGLESLLAEAVLAQVVKI